MLDAVSDQGWRVEASSDGYKLYAPSGSGIVLIHRTPSARNWQRKAVGQIRPVRREFQMERTLMEYDVLAVLPAYEREELDRSAEQLLTAFMETHPETGPVASVDLVHDTFDIAFTVEADAHSTRLRRPSRCSTGRPTLRRSCLARSPDSTSTSPWTRQSRPNCRRRRRAEAPLIGVDVRVLRDLDHSAGGNLGIERGTFGSDES